MFEYAAMLATDWRVAVTGLALSGGYAAYRKLNKPPPRKPKFDEEAYRLNERRFHDWLYDRRPWM